MCSCDTQYTNWLAASITVYLTQIFVVRFAFRENRSFLFFLMKSTTSFCLDLSAICFKVQSGQRSTWQRLQWCSTGLGRNRHRTTSCPCDVAMFLKMLKSENNFLFTWIIYNCLYKKDTCKYAFRSWIWKFITKTIRSSN